MILMLENEPSENPNLCAVCSRTLGQEATPVIAGKPILPVLMARPEGANPLPRESQQPGA